MILRKQVGAQNVNIDMKGGVGGVSLDGILGPLRTPGWDSGVSKSTKTRYWSLYKPFGGILEPLRPSGWDSGSSKGPCVGSWGLQGNLGGILESPSAPEWDAEAYKGSRVAFWCL